MQDTGKIQDAGYTMQDAGYTSASSCVGRNKYVSVQFPWRASVPASTPVVSIRPSVVYSTTRVLAGTLARQGN